MSQIRSLPRRPDWRWARVVDLSPYTDVQAIARLQNDDATTRELFKFKRELDKGFTHNFTELGDAHKFFINWPIMRLQVEGYLLAGADNERIAKHLGCTERTVQYYHDVFFDVRWALESDNEGWLVAAVFGTLPHHGAHIHDTLGLVHRIAWFGGIDLVERYFKRGLQPEVIKEYVTKFVKDVLGKHVIETVLAKPSSPEDAEMIRVMYDINTKDKDATETPIDKEVEEFLSTLSLSVADVTSKSNLLLPERELRDAEILGHVKDATVNTVT